MSSRSLDRTVTINVTDCGCGSNYSRPAMLGSFRIPDTGDAQINCRIAYRIMEKRFGKQYECRARDTCDYHFAFGPEPVGKWTGNEPKAEDDLFEQVKTRLNEIDSRLQESINSFERDNLIAEKRALKTWLGGEDILAMKLKHWFLIFLIAFIFGAVVASVLKALAFTTAVALWGAIALGAVALLFTAYKVVAHATRNK